ncbi:MAG: rod-capping linker protein [Oscillatoria sp. SIO1A7]|nr:rod-capping linker protein [Oscillatoria sp. SIO1A7]
MSGMTTIGIAGLSDYDNRTVTIEVTALCRQETSRTSNYAVKVPFNRMSQAMQNINRLGGKVAGVTIVTPPPPPPSPEEGQPPSPEEGQ